jgi:hypothetical protein
MTGDGTALNMVRVKGTCRICGYQGMLDPHHIISQAQCKKLNRLDLISNPGNVVHICRHCHDKTTASKVRQYLEKKEKAEKKPKKAKKKKATNQGRCEAMTELAGRCKRNSKPGHHVCGFHLPRRKAGFRRKWHRE